jgi:hypothetical protein
VKGVLAPAGRRTSRSGAFALFIGAAATVQPIAPHAAAATHAMVFGQNSSKGSGGMNSTDNAAWRSMTSIIFTDDPLPSRSVIEARLGAKLAPRRTLEDYETFGFDAAGHFGFKFEVTFQGATTSGIRIELPGTAWRDTACITPDRLVSQLMAVGWGKPYATTFLIQQLEFRRPGMLLSAEHNNLCVLRLDIVHL